MKNLYLIVFTATVVLSCSQKKDYKSIIRQNAEAYLNDKLHDPDSYEFISLGVLDTITYQDNIEDYRQSETSQIGWLEGRIERQIDNKKSLPSIFDETELNDSRKELSEIKIRLSKLDSIEKALGTKLTDPAAYLVSYSFRANNKMGALNVHDQYLQVSAGPEFSVLKMTDDLSKLFSTPNGFPGLQDLYTQTN